MAGVTPTARQAPPTRRRQGLREFAPLPPPRFHEATPARATRLSVKLRRHLVDVEDALNTVIAATMWRTGTL